MYKIIGTDGKEYGPASADQLRRWISEGRVNGQTQVLAEGASAWQPIAALPEFAASMPATPADDWPSGQPPQTVPAPAPAGPTESAADILASDYSVDIGDCLARAWDLVKQNFWPMVGISALVTVLLVGINQVLGLLSGPAINDMINRRQVTPSGIALVLLTSWLSRPVYAVFFGGLFQYLLKLIRREPAGIGDAFSGFTLGLGQLVLLGLVSGLLELIGWAFCVLPGIYLGVAWMFAIPLVVDKRLGFWDAMELSRRMVSKHWFLLFGLALLAGVVTMLGLFACCVGVFVTAPIGWAALMYAYEDIIGRRLAPAADPLDRP